MAAETEERVGVSQRPIVLGVGAISVDYLVTVATFPKPDDKIRSTTSKIQGGGNGGNALTCAARLGLKPKLISKVASDTQGKSLLVELEADGVDTSHVVVSEEGNSPFTYVIVDSQTGSRTCINTPGYPTMEANDLSQISLSSAMNKAKLIYLDSRLQEAAIVVAREAIRKKIPILLDAERKRERLDEFLELSSYIVCTKKFLQSWTKPSSTPGALVSLLLKLTNVKFVIVTLGEKGCIMLEKAGEDSPETTETDIDIVFKSIEERIDQKCASPTCIASEVPILNNLEYSSLRLSADGIGSISGKLYLCTAERIPPSELIDTTGAGDAFIGAILYGLCMEMLPEKMLPFASQVAACGCRALGARTGLPFASDPRLLPFL